VIKGAADNLAEQEQKSKKSGISRSAARFMGVITETSWCDGKCDRRLGTSLATSVLSSLLDQSSYYE
jgi:hypothetical protein